MYEVPLGGRPRLVARLPFERLNQGQELRVRVIRTWDASSPAEGEFPPSYRLVIAYDPDIRLDGNPHNDDVDLHNNTLERSGDAINRLFR
ncbi:MAG: hypothetical protein NZU63_05450 [Gemmataceae bacterium]|nr:hypothetical protein [Gemmataceae bacterium]